MTASVLEDTREVVAAQALVDGSLSLDSFLSSIAVSSGATVEAVAGPDLLPAWGDDQKVHEGPSAVECAGCGWDTCAITCAQTCGLTCAACPFPN